MDSHHTGFIWNIKKPTESGYTACLVITPKFNNKKADTGSKIERNIRRDMALQIAEKMLAMCGETKIVSEVSKLRKQAH